MPHEVDGLIARARALATAPACSSFPARAELLELLELHAPGARAEPIRGALEAANERAASRLRTRIAAGRYTSQGLARAFARCAGERRGRLEYDALDSLLASLLDAGSLPDEEATREPEMVAYQPTPGRVILELLERAQLGASDVLVDVGSGLGWVAITAALLSDARAIGIELEPTFVAYARACARMLNLSRAVFVAADARVASLDTGTVYFLYTPFRGQMLRDVLGRLEAQAHTRPIRVFAYGPCTLEIERAGWPRLHPSDAEVGAFAPPP
jgi:hypothetical protein